MHTYSKVLSYTFVILLVFSILASCFRFFVLKDYTIEAQIDCDPAFESCYIWHCEEGIDCTGNPEVDIWYYKIAHRIAKNIPICESEDESCDQFICMKDEVGCEIIYCDPDADVCSTILSLEDNEEQTIEANNTESNTEETGTSSTQESDQNE